MKSKSIINALPQNHAVFNILPFYPFTFLLSNYVWTIFSRKRHRHLRAEQHRRKVSQLSARAAVHGKAVGGKRRIRCHNKRVCIHGTAARDTHIRNGDYLLPLHQQGGGEPAEGVLHHSDSRRTHLAAVRRGCAGVHQTHIRRHGLCRPSVVCMGNGYRSGSRRLPVHSLRIPALQETPGEVRRTEVFQHRADHRAQPRFLPASARPLRWRRRRLAGERDIQSGGGCGLRVLHQPVLLLGTHVLPAERAYGLPLCARPRTVAAHVFIQLADTRARHRGHSQPDSRQDSLPLHIQER